MMCKPTEIRYLHRKRIVFIEYSSKRIRVDIPIDYLYKYFTNKPMDSKDYLVSIEDKTDGIKFIFSDNNVCLSSWDNLILFVENFKKEFGTHETI